MFLAEWGRVSVAPASFSDALGPGAFGVVLPSFPAEKQVMRGWFPAATESASRVRMSNVRSRLVYDTSSTLSPRPDPQELFWTVPGAPFGPLFVTVIRARVASSAVQLLAARMKGRLMKFTAGGTPKPEGKPGPPSHGWLPAPPPAHPPQGALPAAPG